jgi:hypothetical protein
MVQPKINYIFRYTQNGIMYDHGQCGSVDISFAINTVKLQILYTANIPANQSPYFTLWYKEPLGILAYNLYRHIQPIFINRQRVFKSVCLRQNGSIT